MDAAKDVDYFFTTTKQVTSATWRRSGQVNPQKQVNGNAMSDVHLDAWQVCRTIGGGRASRHARDILGCKAAKQFPLSTILY
jgi:hypothetical protein